MKQQADNNGTFCVGVRSCSQVSTLCSPRHGETIVKEKEGEETRGLSKFVGNSLTTRLEKVPTTKERERERKEEDRFINTMFREALVDFLRRQITGEH